MKKKNWEFYEQLQVSQKRFLEKKKTLIHKNLSALLGEEMFLKGEHSLLYSFEELVDCKIRFSDSKEKLGMGKKEKGEEFCLDKEESKQKKAGSKKGFDWEEKGVSLEEIDQLLRKELDLPYADYDELIGSLPKQTIEWERKKQVGILPLLDKKQTLKSSFRHNHPSVLQNDFVFHEPHITEKQNVKATVFALMDVSGSMGMWEKHMARTFFFWMNRFLKTKYEEIEIHYLTHHTEAQEVTEEVFFKKGESGGTICSCVYKKALEIIQNQHSPKKENIYCIHFSDGDNLTSDNMRSVRLIQELLQHTVFTGYVELNQYSRFSTLYSSYKNIQHERFLTHTIKKKSDILEALQTFFPKKSDKEKRK